MRSRTLLIGLVVATVVGAGGGALMARENAPTTLQIAPVKNEDERAKLLKSGELPIQLTSSDGTGLRLSSVKASAAIEDPLALTELHLVFENPEDRILEGTFRISLPQSASVSRFAMKVGEGGVWKEGAVVEKQRARQIYEDLLHHNQEPALMEQTAGNQFSARVFPIPAKGKKEIVIAYSEVLEAGSPYVVPLKGLPTLSAIDIDVRALGSNKARLGGNGRWALHQTSLAPAEDFVVGAESLPRSSGLRSSELVIARVVPFTSSRPDPIESVVFLVDTSASRALGLSEQTKLLEQTIKKLPPEAIVSVMCFDQEVAPIFEGTASSFSDRDRTAILDRGALGASDFEGAISWAGEEAKRRNAHRVVLLTDGVATAGETDYQRIKTEVEKLRAKGVTRIDAIATGGIRDDGFLRSIVRGVLERDGVVLDAKLGADAVAQRLAERTSSGVPIKVEGASWSWPKTLDGLQTGDEIVIHAEMPAGGKEAPIRIDVGGQVFTPDLRSATRPLVERSWAQAKIQSMIESPPAGADPAATKATIIALSQKHRVLSPHTALLVFENEADLQQQNGLAKNGDSEILTVDDGRVAVVKNQKDDEQRKAKEEAEKKGGKAVSQPAASAAPMPMPVPTPTPTPPAFSAAFDQKKKTPATETPGRATTLPPATKTDDGKRRADGTATTTEEENKDKGGLLEKGANQSPPPPPPQDPAPPPVVTIPTTPPATATASGYVAPLPSPRAAAPPAPVTRPRPPSNYKPPAPTPTGGQANRRSGGDGDDETAKPKKPVLKAEHDREIAPTPSQPSSSPSSSSPQAHVRSVVVVQNGLLTGEAQKVVRAATPQVRACYNADGLRHHLEQNNNTLELRLVINSSGGVETVTSLRSDRDTVANVASCVFGALRALKFPAPANGQATIDVKLTFEPPAAEKDRERANTPIAKGSEAYSGRFAVVMTSLARGEKNAALGEARRWHEEHPEDVMGLIALGETLEATGDIRTAARAYGSILELYPTRADSRRFAGERLERLKDAGALRLAVDTYKKSVAHRPDHPASHRLYGFALLKQGEHEKAFEAIKVGAARGYPEGRFISADRILHEDLGLIAAAWMRAEPQRAGEIKNRLRAAGGLEESEPSLRFVLLWETDDNDVDFHITDGKGRHAFFGEKDIAAQGGELYADVRNGYGPECFTIRGAADRRAYPFTLQANYYSRGPMGYGMGKLEVIEHDGKGNLLFDERPYVVMSDRAFVDLGKVDRSEKDKDKDRVASSGGSSASIASKGGF